MRRVVITGLGFISSVGNNKESVYESIRDLKTGIEPFDEFKDPKIPVHLAGTIKEFSFPTYDPEDWEYPREYRLNRIQLRPMAPNCLFGFCAMKQAIEDAQLSQEEISNERTSILSASAGSVWLTYEMIKMMNEEGIERVPPLALVGSIPGDLNINLATCYKIKGGSLGLVSACASSAHVIGYAVDSIRNGRQKRIFAVGAEDLNKYMSLPFAAVRALSTQSDPSSSPCAFDKKRDGFVATGGGAALVLESLEEAQARGATIYAEVLGWGESSDGYNVMTPEPNGEGLIRAMKLAIENAHINANEIDYINAHATSTPVGDAAELKAIKAVFGKDKTPWVSSTKTLTGHGLSLAGALEAGISCLALEKEFTPVSANITEPDEEAEGVRLVDRKIDHAPQIIMSNSSGFGGSNVSLIFRKYQAE